MPLMSSWRALSSCLAGRMIRLASSSRYGAAGAATMPEVLVPTRVPSRRSFTAPLNASHAEAQLRSVSTTSGRCSSGTLLSV